MEESDGQWEKLESRSKPGRFYYYNRATKQSSWKLPSPALSDSSTRVAKKTGESNGMKPISGEGVLGGAGIAPREAIPGQVSETDGVMGQSLGRSRTGARDDAKEQDGGKLTADNGWKATAQDSCGSKGSTSENVYHHSYSAASSVKVSADQTVGRDSSLARGTKTENDVLEDAVAGSEISTEISLEGGLTAVQQLAILDAVNNVSLKLSPSCTAEGVCEGPLPISEKRFKHELYLVLDTGTMLTHLQTLREFRGSPMKVLAKQAVLVVPWMVVAKLSVLLKSSVSTVQQRATKAAEFLRECIATGHPHVIFQTLDEALSVESRTNMDPIVCCSLDYQHAAMARQGVAVLWTDDILLSSAALTAGVRAANRKTLIPLLITLTGVQQRNVSIFGGSGHYNHLTQSLCVCDCELVVSVTLSVVIMKEMIVGYDNLWFEVVAVKPPWTLQNTLAIVDKHWMAVFGFVVERTLKRTCLDRLVSYARMHANSIARPAQLEEFVRQSITFFDSFGSQPVNKYNDLLGHSINILNTIVRNFSSGGHTLTRMSPFQSQSGNPFQSYLSPTKQANTKPPSIGIFSPNKSGFQNPAGSPKTSPSFPRSADTSPVTATTTMSRYTASCLTPPTPSSPAAVHVTSPITPTTTPVSSSHTSPVFNFTQYHPASESSSPARGSSPMTPSKLMYSTLCNKADTLVSQTGLDNNFLSVPGVVKDILTSRPSRGRGRGRGRVPGGTTEANSAFNRPGLHSESPLVGDVPIRPGSVESWQEESGMRTKNKDTISTAG